MNPDIQTYNAERDGDVRVVCEALAAEIEESLPDAESKIWHRHPVWFFDGNPVVGYSQAKDGVRLLFWSGQSFHEPGLTPEGKFMAAEIRFTSHEQIDRTRLKRWLAECRDIQWDYKNIVKRKGRLERLT
ncbi:MAG: DUF1801 domain-containing protein [Gemmatimonadota bacterium]